MKTVFIPVALKHSVGRFASYIAIMLVLMGLVALDAYGFSKHGFSEISWVEFSQLFFLLVSTLLCWRVYKSGHMVNAAVLLGAFFIASFIRECDGFLDKLIFPGSWKLFVFPLVALALWRTWRKRKEFISEMSQYVSSVSFGLFCAGFLSTYIFSRFFGMSFLWKSIMGEGYMRIAKNAAEECTELLGYVFLFLAMIELLILVRKMTREPTFATAQKNFQASSSTSTRIPPESSGMLAPEEKRSPLNQS